MVYKVVIKVDGACRGNGKRWAIGGVGAVFIPRNGGQVVGWRKAVYGDANSDYPYMTNQRAELSAMIFALELALEKRETLSNAPYLKVVIKSDSTYAVDCMTKWIENWRENGWLNSRGQDVCNQDLIQEIDYLWDRIVEEEGGGDVSFEWISRKENTFADRMANKACDDQDSD